VGIILTGGRRCGTWSKPRKWLPRVWTLYEMPVGSLVVHVWAKKWWGVSAFSGVKSGRRSIYWTGVTSVQELPVKKRKRPDGVVSDATHLAAMESELFRLLMPLVEHMACTKYEDGEARKPGWVTVKTMGSAWVVEIKDPDTACRMQVVQQSLDDALINASKLVSSEDAPWEPDQWLRQQEAKKKK